MTNRLLFLHAHREVSDLTNEILEESGQFRILCDAFLVNIKGCPITLSTPSLVRGLLGLLEECEW